jgi:hypothetical protein
MTINLVINVDRKLTKYVNMRTGSAELRATKPTVKINQQSYIQTKS